MFSFADVDKRLATLAEEATPWERAQAKERTRQGRGASRGGSYDSRNPYEQVAVEHVEPRRLLEPPGPDPHVADIREHDVITRDSGKGSYTSG